MFRRFIRQPSCRAVAYISRSTTLFYDSCPAATWCKMYLELIVRSYLSISMFVICGLTVCIDTIGKDITPFRRYYATRCQAAKNRKTDFSSREPKPVSISIISLINCSLEKGGVLSQACSPHSLPGQSLLPQRQKSS